MVLAIEADIPAEFKEADIPVKHLELLLDEAGMHTQACCSIQ